MFNHSDLDIVYFSDLPSSRSHELMSSSGLAFSWHDDYINSPYQTNVDSPDKKTPVITPAKGMPTTLMGEERKKLSDICVIDFAKDGEPSPQDRARSPLEPPESCKVSLQGSRQKSDRNANLDLKENEVRRSGRRRSNSSCSEPNKIESGQRQNNRPYRKKSAPHIFVSLYRSSQDEIQVPVQFDNIQCEEFMSTPTISNSSLDSIGSGKLRAVMCGNDVIYVPDEKENRSYNSATASITSSPNASGSYISMEEGDLNASDLPDDVPQMKGSRSGSSSSGRVPCIYLDESMLESIDYVADPTSEKSDFTFENEMSPKSVSSKLPSRQGSPLVSHSMETSPASSRSSLKSFPTTDPYSSPCISKNERQFDTDPDMIDEEMGNRSDDDVPPCSHEYDDWRRQPLRSNSPHLRDSSDDEESEEWPVPSALRIPRRQTSPSISDDENDEEDEEIRQERGRTMVRRSSRTRTPIQENFSKLDKENYETDDFPVHLPSTLSNITITLDECNSSCSAGSSPERITPYQDNMILDFVNGVISESIRLVRNHAPADENTPSDEITNGVINGKSVDEEIQTFIKEGDEKFQESKIVAPPTVVAYEEPKSTAFAQKGWDRLPHNVSDAELRAFAEHTILYNEMIMSGRITPVKIQLDTVTEESVLESDVNPSNGSRQIRSTNHEIPLGLPREVPKPEQSPTHFDQNSEHDCPELSNYFSNEPQSSSVKTLTNKFEERMADAEINLPSCVQNSDSDSSFANGVEQSSQEISQGLEARSSDEENTEETEKRESSLSSSSDGKQDEEVENRYLPPGIGISQLFYSPHASPAKHTDSEDMVFMFQMQPENYEKASIIELNENDKSDANDILQGVPLLEDSDDDEDDEVDPFDIPFGARQNYFKFKPKKDESSQRFSERETETATNDLTSNENVEKPEKTFEAPPVAKKPVRHTQDTVIPEKPPALAKKPVRPQQDPPPIPKKPIMRPQSGTGISEGADISSVSTKTDSVAPKTLSYSSNPAHGSPINSKPMQELFSQETSVKSLDPIGEVNIALKETVEPVVEPASPVRQRSEPVSDCGNLPKSTDDAKMLASSFEKPVTLADGLHTLVEKSVNARNDPVSPVRQVSSFAKDQADPDINVARFARHFSSPMKQTSSPTNNFASPVRQVSSLTMNIDSSVRQVSSPAKNIDSPVRQASGPAKNIDSPVRHVSSPVKNLDSPMRQVPSPAKNLDSPVRQVSSLTMNIDSPVRQVSSPAKNIDSPVRQVSSPAKNFDSPVRQVFSPAKNIDSPVRQVSSPAKNIDSPVRQVFSPAKNIDSPVRQVSSPAKNIDSPVRQVSSPAKNIDSPVRQVSSPAKNIDSPVRQVSSPAKNIDSPVRQVSSPAKNIDSPVRQVSSPVRQVSSPAKNLDSPVRQVSSPAKNIDSPVRQVSGLAKNIDSPMRQVSNLAKSFDSPVRQVSSPAKNIDSPVRQVSSPAKNIDSPVRQVSSPAKNIDSPFRQVSSPTKDSASPERQVASPTKDLSSSTGQVTIPAKGPPNPAMQVASPVKSQASPVKDHINSMNLKQADSPVKQQPCSAGQVSSSVTDHVKPENQPITPESENNVSAKHVGVSPAKSTLVSDKQQMSSEQSETELEHPNQSAECSQIRVHPSSDHSSSSSDTAGIDPIPESPDYKNLEGQVPLMSPAKRAIELCGEEKRLSVDLTDQTDLSEASNLSYAMAQSSIDSEDCFFDSQPDAEVEGGDYAKIMATYKPACDQTRNSGNDDDETTSNGTLHSDVMSTHSESKSDDGGNNNNNNNNANNNNANNNANNNTAEDNGNPKDSHSSC